MTDKSQPSRRSLWLFGILLVVAIVAAGTFFRFSVLFKFVSLAEIERGIDLARSHAWMSALFLIIFVLGVMLLPVTIFAIVGGVIFNFWMALFLNISAATLGSYFSFRVGRILGRERLEKLFGPKMRQVDQWTGKLNIPAVALLRVIGIPPFIIQNYALGLTSLSSRNYLVGTALGILPWNIMIALAANSLWRTLLLSGEKGLSKALFELGRPLLVLAVLITTSVLIGTWLKKRNKKTET